MSTRPKKFIKEFLTRPSLSYSHKKLPEAPYRIITKPTKLKHERTHHGISRNRHSPSKSIYNKSSVNNVKVIAHVGAASDLYHFTSPGRC